MIDIYSPMHYLFEKFRDDNVSPARFSFVFSRLCSFFRGFCVCHDCGDKKDRKKSNFINYSSVTSQFVTVFPDASLRWTSCRSFFSFETRISRGRIFWINPLNRSRPESHVCALWCDVRVRIHMHASVSSVACVLYIYICVQC